MGPSGEKEKSRRLSRRVGLCVGCSGLCAKGDVSPTHFVRRCGQAQRRLPLNSFFILFFLFLKLNLRK